MTNDLRLIHTQGLDEGIRCAMCTNTMKSDKGCDGGCVVDQKMYEKVLKVIDKALEAQPSEDCISRQAVDDAIYDYSRSCDVNYEQIMEFIDKLPSVKPKYTDEEIDKAQAVEQAYVDKMVELAVEETKRPKGKWISHREHCENLGVMPSGLGAYEWCSNCDCGIDVIEWHRNPYNYCPNCGAEMNGGGEDGAETR